MMKIYMCVLYGRLIESNLLSNGNLERSERESISKTGIIAHSIGSRNKREIARLDVSFEAR